MSKTWWLADGDLDEHQKKIVMLPPDESALITGPPGSGKTNMLLLRANFLHLRNLKNLAVVTFTRTLRDFIADGATNYDFPASKIVTLREWQHDMLQQYGGERVQSTNDFDKDRSIYLSALKPLLKRNASGELYDAILLDEAQDYSSEEIRMFAGLTQRLFCVADGRQKIYRGDDSLDEIKRHVGDNVFSLEYHYRNGYNICKVADEIAKGMEGHESMAESAQYDEKHSPSTVDLVKCASFDEQMKKVLERMRLQLTSFPGELIGVLCPKNESVSKVWAAIQTSPLANASVQMGGGGRSGTFAGKRIVVSGFHSAKGLEFRALHLVMCEELKKFGQNRRMAFTAVTRAKTALSLYHSEAIHPYLEQAVGILDPPTTDVTLDNVLGKRS